jgi:hypothetical protein
MPREALHTDSIKIQQKPIISAEPDVEREPEIVKAEKSELEDIVRLDALKMAEEPVTIRLEPTAEKNAAMQVPVWNNGKGCEVLITPDGRYATSPSDNGRWFEWKYIPVATVITIKRKYLETILRAKTDTVYTKVLEPESERPNNVIERFTTPISSLSIIEDRNPKGIAWLQEIRRRNF